MYWNSQISVKCLDLLLLCIACVCDEDLLYEVHRVNLPDAKQLYCVWICRSHTAASTVATGARGGTVSCTTLDSSHNVSADCTTAYSCAALGDSQNCSGDAVCIVRDCILFLL
jgi:hypothetical protein